MKTFEVESLVPRGYDPAHPAPLVILLHGYGASGELQDAYFGLGKLADERRRTGPRLRNFGLSHDRPLAMRYDSLPTDFSSSSHA